MHSFQLAFLTQYFVLTFYFISFHFLKIDFIHLKNFWFLFLAVFCLRCCVQAFSSCGERGLLFIAVHGLFIAVAFLVVEHGL